MHDTQLLPAYSAEEKVAYLSAIASLASADRQVSAAETEFLQALAQFAGLEEGAMQQVLAAAQGATNQSIQYALDVLINSELRFSLVTDLISFARADGAYADAEEAMIGKMAQYLGISPEQKQTLEIVVDQAARVPHDPHDPAKQGFFKGVGGKLSGVGIPESALTTGLLGVMAPLVVSRGMSRGQNQGPGTRSGGMGGGNVGGLLGGADNGGQGGMLGGLLGSGVLGGLMGGGATSPQGPAPGGGVGSMLSVLGGLSGRPHAKIFNGSIFNNAPLLDLLNAGGNAPASMWDDIHEGVRSAPGGEGNVSNDGVEGLASTRATAPETEESRQLLVETQEEVRTTETFALTIQVVTGALPVGPNEGASPFPAGFVGQLDLDVKAPGLQLVSPSFQQLNVPARGDSGKLRFLLRAAVAGTYRIRVDAWNGAAYLASVEVAVHAEAAQAEATAPSPPPAPFAAANDETSVNPSQGTARMALGWRAPEPDEYTLTVEYDPDRRTHTFRLMREGEFLPPMESAPLVGTREQILSGLNGVMNELARNKPRYDYAQARDWLEGKGAQMFRELLPKELQQVLWDARHRMARLNIIAPGAQLPWEMLFLMDPAPAPESNEPGLFLADATVVVRWLYGEGAPAIIQRAPAYVVIPANSPPSAQQEHASVELVCGPPTLVSDLNGLRELTRNGTFRWLHFASHNITLPGQFGTSYIPFGESPFSQELMESIPARRYAADRPLVFMNACTTAGAQPLFTETNGWADTFLKRGAAAFLGSLWEVRDQSAAAFARAFYQALKDGQNLGDALRAARAALDPGDPTYLAYALYGNPRATLQ